MAETVRVAERGDVRLQSLYEVSKVLTRFGHVQPTLFAVIDIVQRTISLRSAILILDAERTRRTIVWHPHGVSAAWMRASKARARASYAHLVGAIRATPAWLNEALATDEHACIEPSRRPAVLLPLTVHGRPVFGALQLESAGRFDARDVIFVKAVVNQLAVAVDRYEAIEAQRAATRRPPLEAENQRTTSKTKQLCAKLEDGAARARPLDAARQRATGAGESVGAERKRAAADALRERYQALVDNLDQAIVWEADAETRRISYVSGRVEALLGFTRQRWLDEHDLWMSCVHPRDRGALAQTFAAALVEATDQRCDHRCITADGRVLWFQTRVHVARRQGGASLQGMSLDITATKESERRLRSQLDFTRAVTDGLGEGVIAVDLESRVTLCNPAAARMLGWESEEVVGRPVASVVRVLTTDGAPRPQVESPFEAALLRGQQAEGDRWLFEGRAGQPFPVSLISAPLKREGRISGVVLAFQDITERRQNQQALERAGERARRAARDREALLALVSQDLKNPLRLISMTLARMAQKSAVPSLRRTKARLQIIRCSAERMNCLIRDVLDAASIDAGKLIVEPEPTGVASLVDGAIDAMTQLAAAKAIEIVRDLPAETHRVWADPSRLQQVFANLIGNALEFTPPGGSITLGALPLAEGVQFTVADTGAGIPEDELPHLFQRFYQSRRPGRPDLTDRTRRGLGLSIVKGIVLAHGGQVWVTSELGTGSTFCFTLRGARSSAAEDPEPAAEERRQLISPSS